MRRYVIRNILAYLSKSPSGKGKYACITLSHIILLSYLNQTPPPLTSAVFLPIMKKKILALLKKILRE